MINTRRETQLKKMLERAQIFLSRKAINPSDGKRHDPVKDDEAKWMLDVRNKLGWSRSRIAGTLERDPRSVNKAITRYEEAHVKKTATSKKRTDNLDTIEQLKSFKATICGNELSAADILYSLRWQLTAGIKRYEELIAIASHFGGTVQGEPNTSSFEVFAKFNLLKITDLQFRREGKPVALDIGYWVLTDFGKDVIQLLEES